MGELKFAYDQIEPLAHNLKLNDEIIERAENIAGRADMSGEPARSPTGIAAGAVYLASILEGDSLSQRRISNAADVSVGTIWDCYTDLMIHDDDLPEYAGSKDLENRLKTKSEALVSEVDVAIEAGDWKKAKHLTKELGMVLWRLKNE